MYDFQDGCSPGDDVHVFKSIELSHEVFPGAICSVRVSELENDGGKSKIVDEIGASLSQPQVRWLMLPMCDTPEDVATFKDIVNSIDKSWLTKHGQLQIICETPRCLSNLDAMLASHPEIAGVVIGGGDFSRFAQMDVQTLTSFLRWDVLITCLSHQRFAIDSPLLAIDTQGEAYFKSSAQAGMRAAVVLHPAQVESCHESFSPRLQDVKATLPEVDVWMNQRRTGYRRGTFDEFVGPPHMKLMEHVARYSAEICSKPTFTMKVGTVLVHSLKHFFGTTPSASSLLEPMLTFLALGVSAHPNPSRLILNIGSFDCKWESAAETGGKFTVPSITEASFVMTRVLHRRITSTGKMVTTSRVVVLDAQHEPQFSFVRKLLEEPIPLDTSTKADESWLAAAEDLPAHIALGDVLARAGPVVEERSVATPDIRTHAKFCTLLGYDAPVHHTETPTVPSALHLACHQIFGATEAPLRLSDVTFHAQMKPGQGCTAAVHADLAIPGSYISVLRVADGEAAGKVLSTVSFEQASH